MNWKVHAHYNISNDATELYLIREEVDGSRAFVLPLQLEKRERGDRAGILPTLGDQWSDDETKAFLQAMADAAWEQGIRPKQIEDLRNELKAVREHRDDMRALAFKATDVLITKP